MTPRSLTGLASASTWTRSTWCPRPRSPSINRSTTFSKPPAAWKSGLVIATFIRRPRAAGRFPFELGDPFGEYELRVAILLAIAGEGLEREDHVAVDLGLAIEERLQHAPDEAAQRRQRAAERPRLEDARVDERRARAQLLHVIEQRPRRRQRRQVVPAPEIGVQAQHQAGKISRLLQRQVARFACFWHTLVPLQNTFAAPGDFEKQRRTPVLTPYLAITADHGRRRILAPTLRLYMTLWFTTDISSRSPSRRSCARSAAAIAPKSSAVSRMEKR